MKTKSGERARANSKTHEHVNSQSANVLLLLNHKKVNSYKERKNNSYKTETLLLSDCKMKLMKNDEKRSCLPNAEEDGVGGQGHRGKNLLRRMLLH